MRLKPKGKCTCGSLILMRSVLSLNNPAIELISTSGQQRFIGSALSEVMHPTAGSPSKFLKGSYHSLQSFDPPEEGTHGHSESKKYNFAAVHD